MPFIFFTAQWWLLLFDHCHGILIIIILQIDSFTRTATEQRCVVTLPLYLLYLTPWTKFPSSGQLLLLSVL